MFTNQQFANKCSLSATPKMYYHSPFLCSAIPYTSTFRPHLFLRILTLANGLLILVLVVVVSTEKGRGTQKGDKCSRKCRGLLLHCYFNYFQRWTPKNPLPTTAPQRLSVVSGSPPSSLRISIHNSSTTTDCHYSIANKRGIKALLQQYDFPLETATGWIK